MVPSIPVHLLPYDPAWPEIAVVEMAKLEALPGLMSAMHHIGSTSVPGLMAKPVVDLIGMVEDIGEIDRRQAELEAIGYRGFGEFGVPGRRFFTLDNAETGERITNLHCYQKGSESARNQIAFRDYLRAHPETAVKYAAEKQRAMKLFPDNSTKYASEKGPFILDTLQRALGWVSEQGGRW